MPIGTSLGAYFESPFHQEAGIETPQEVTKPKDTGDDNVLPPDSSQTVKSTEPQPVSDIKTSSPLVTITDDDIDKGMSLGMGFAGGGFHATLESLGLLPKLGAELSTSADGLPVTVHLQGPGHEALTEGPDVFQQFMASRGTRQSSNIESEGVSTPTEPAPRQLNENDSDYASRLISHALDRGVSTDDISGALRNSLRLRPTPPADHPDFTNLVSEHYNQLVDFSNTQPAGWMPRGIRPDEGLHAFAERMVHQADPNLRTQGHAPDPVSLEQEPFDWEAESQRQSDSAWQRHLTEIERIKNSFGETSDVVQNKGVSLKPTRPIGSGYDKYNFMNDAGNVGEMTIQEKNGGKTLWVPWMGTVGTLGPHDIGTKEIRALIPMIKNLYPNAEQIGGFRISGARGRSGSTEDAYLKLR